MKKKVLMAVLLGCACLTAAGCSFKKSGETEAKTEAATQTGTEAKTQSSDETESELLTEEAASEESTEKPEEASEAMSEEAEEITAEELGERPEYNALDYVTVGDYKGLTVTVDPVQVTEEDVDAAIEERVANAEMYDDQTDGTVQEGDTVNIDYEGKKDGVAFDGGTAQGFDLTIGSDTFIDGFEDGLIGVEVGDTVDLNLTFPENYGSEELAGQEVVFTVTVNSVKVMPEVTDTLVDALSEGAYSTVDGYRAYLKEELESQATQDQEGMIYQDLMIQLYNICTVNEYPQDLVDYSEASMRQVYESYAEQYGMELADFTQQFFGMTEEQFQQAISEAVEQNLQAELILIAIAQQEGLTISDEEFQTGCAEYAENNGYASADDLIAEYGEAMLRIDLLMDKALRFVKENAVIQETPETESESEAVSEAASEEETELAAGNEEPENTTEAVSEGDAAESESESGTDAAGEPVTEEN
ncbi:MAG: trigger factor [Lachnospiraceae bacterium]|nr:trigger factor [Lachnospiraceae bacterium]